MATIQVIPHGIEHLAFSYAAPSDWKIADVPAEKANFDDPEFFLPLAAAVSDCGSGAFTVGARPANADGALIDWLQYICGEDNIEVDTITPWSHGPMRGLRFDARQSADGALLRMRNLYVEDGERLFAICTMAPDALYDGIAPMLAAIAESFQVDNAAGPTVS
jgi:hypothetical protein